MKPFTLKMTFIVWILLGFLGTILFVQTGGLDSTLEELWQARLELSGGYPRYLTKQDFFHFYYWLTAIYEVVGTVFYVLMLQKVLSGKLWAKNVTVVFLLIGLIFALMEAFSSLLDGTGNLNASSLFAYWLCVGSQIVGSVLLVFGLLKLDAKSDEPFVQGGFNRHESY